jgi:heme/copper-type cytochrome/quinol oxidase subunit 1
MLYYWLFFAVSSLVFAGVFAFLAAMTRTPVVKLLPSADYFRISVVAHVIFALVVWFLGFMGALWVYSRPNVRQSEFVRWQAGFWVAVIGVALLGFSALLGLGKPVLIDYVPLVDHPLYFAGMLFLALGVSITILSYAMSIIRRRERKLNIVSYGMLLAGVIAIMAFISVFISAMANGTSSYRILFWGPGHILQFANTLAMVVAWFILLEATLQTNVNEAVVKKLMLVYLLAALALPLIYLLPQPGQKHLFTLGMSYGIGVPSFILAFILLKEVWNNMEGGLTGSRRLPWGNPAFSSIMLSLALFGVGGIIGVPGVEGNLRVPAHYHGALGAVTMAFMGMTYFLLQALEIKIYSKRVAKYQPYLYGIGLLIIIIGLFWAGSYGAPRKAFSYENPLTTLSMNIMGLGAVIAVAGGAAFVVNAMFSLLKGHRIGKPV